MTKLAKLPLVCMFAFGSAPALAETTEADVLRALQQLVATPAPTVEPRASVSRQAVIEVTMNIVVSGPLPADAKINCTVFARHNDASFAWQYNESASRIATRLNATSARCIVPIHFLWPKADTATNVGMNGNIQILTTNTATTHVSARNVSFSIGSIPLPAQNATARVTVSSRI
jgi:hypothetical protein